MSRHYYPLANVWDSLIVPILDDPRVKAIVDFIFEEIRQDVLLKGSQTTSSIRGEFLDSILPTLKVCATPAEQRAFLSRYGWGRFSPVEVKEDESMYKQVATVENDNPQKLGYYLYLHNCDLLVMLVWTWCRILWPTKIWKIMIDNHHAFVMETGDECTIYDLWWQAMGIDVDCIEPEVAISYTNPVTYYALNTDIDPWSNREDMMAYVSSKYPPQHWLATVAIAGTLRIQKAFSWLRDDNDLT